MDEQPIVIISGSVRSHSHTRIVSKSILTLFQQQTDTVELIDLRDLPNQAFNINSFEKDSIDKITQTYLDKITQARVLLIVVPEYNGSYPGVLKHFIDLWEYPQAWDKKIVSFVGLAGGQWGGSRPIDHLESIFSYREAILYRKRTLIPYIYQEVDKNTLSPKIMDRLEKHISLFYQFCKSISSW